MDKVLKQAKKITKNLFVLGTKKVNEKLTTPVPWNKKCFYLNREIKEYDHVLRKLSKIHKAEYIPMFDLLNKEDLEDGLHPNSKGHEKIFERLKEILIEKKIF